MLQAFVFVFVFRLESIGLHFPQEFEVSIEKYILTHIYIWRFMDNACFSIANARAGIL